MEAAGCGNLAPHIQHERVIDPAEWQRLYGLQHGAAFGLAHGLDQLAVFRPPVKDSKVSSCGALVARLRALLIGQAVHAGWHVLCLPVPVQMFAQLPYTVPIDSAG